MWLNIYQKSVCFVPSLESTVNEQNTQLEELQKEVVVLREAVKGPRPVMVDFGLQTIQESNSQTMTVDESSAQTDVSGSKWYLKEYCEQQ